MGRPTDPPTFPVIDDDPAAGKVFQSFRGSDWRNFALTTGFSIPFGYWAGRPVVMIPTMYAATAIGAIAGVTMGMQNSYARLTGYAENSVEVAKARKSGALPVSE